MKIIVIRYGALGDTIFMSSILSPLRAQYPHARIDLCLARGMDALFQHDPRVNHCYTLKSSAQPTVINPDKIKLISQSWQSPYDKLILLDGASKSQWLAKWIKAKEKYIVDNLAQEKHIVDCYREFYPRFIDAKFLDDANPKLMLADHDGLTKFKLKPPYVVFATTNSSTAKTTRKNFRAWPREYWQQLIKQASARGQQIVLLSGKHPVESQFVHELGPFADNVFNLAGKTSLADLIDIIDHASALVCTDTGPCHIAAALGTPIVGVYGPTGFNDTGPYIKHGQAATILNSGRPCSPCYDTRAYDDCQKNLCMYDIKPEQVIEALDSILASQEQAQSFRGLTAESKA